MPKAAKPPKEINLGNPFFTGKAPVPQKGLSQFPAFPQTPQGKING